MTNTLNHPRLTKFVVGTAIAASVAFGAFSSRSAKAEVSVREPKSFSVSFPINIQVKDKKGKPADQNLGTVKLTITQAIVVALSKMNEQNIKTNLVSLLVIQLRTLKPLENATAPELRSIANSLIEENFSAFLSKIKPGQAQGPLKLATLPAAPVRMNFAKNKNITFDDESDKFLRDVIGYPGRDEVLIPSIKSKKLVPKPDIMDNERYEKARFLYNLKENFTTNEKGEIGLGQARDAYRKQFPEVASTTSAKKSSEKQASSVPATVSTNTVTIYGLNQAELDRGENLVKSFGNTKVTFIYVNLSRTFKNVPEAVMDQKNTPILLINGKAYTLDRSSEIKAQIEAMQKEQPKSPPPVSDIPI